MKRDLDLIREILLRIEAYEPPSASSLQVVSPSEFSGTVSHNMHHLDLLIDTGLVKCRKKTLEPVYLLDGLSMQGHDFLDAVREKSVWEHTKKQIKAAGGWTFELVVSVAKEEIKRRLLGAV